jgi:hypothetical protein
VAKRMIVVKRPRSWSVRLAVHGILAAGYPDAAVFLISTLHVMVFMGRSLRVRPASSEGSQKPAYRMGRSVKESLITQGSPLIRWHLLLYVILSSQNVSLVRDTNLTSQRCE